MRYLQTWMLLDVVVVGLDWFMVIVSFGGEMEGRPSKGDYDG